MTAKSAPYPPCTVTAFWLKNQDSARCLRRVTQPPHIAGPLVQMELKIGRTQYLDKFLLTSKYCEPYNETPTLNRLYDIFVFNEYHPIP